MRGAGRVCDMCSFHSLESLSVGGQLGDSGQAQSTHAHSRFLSCIDSHVYQKQKRGSSSNNAIVH
eukprot:3928-Heterococcus_DN1.PRE.2